MERIYESLPRTHLAIIGTLLQANRRLDEEHIYLLRKITDQP